jgi:hypothetical protein
MQKTTPGVTRARRAGLSIATAGELALGDAGVNHQRPAQRATSAVSRAGSIVFTSLSSFSNRSFT